MDTVSSLMLPESSTMAGEVDALFYFIMYAGLVLLAIVTILAAFFVLKYRRSKRQTATSGVAHNTPLEIIWTVVPTILIIIVFIWGFRTYLKMNVAPKDALEIKVTAQKWFWTFDYPEGNTSVNELVVPLDKPVKLTMSSKDVIHSFFVPDFRVKMDVLPNRYTITWFQPTRRGDFNIFCAEYCGKGHSEMLGTVKVVSPEEYAAWLEKGSTLGEGMTLAEMGAKLYTARACVTCHKIDGSASTGPTFKNLFGHQVPLENGTQVTADENYLRESMLNPMAKIVAGFQPVMPTYQGILKDREIDALIAYIKSLQTEKDTTDE